jgi:hypothetical protein
MKTLERLNEINTELDLNYIYQDGMSFDEFIEAIQNYISEQEIIYYSKAMEFLRDNDNSLKDSLEIAIEYGYTIENVNSELLATLLHQKLLNEDLSEVMDEIQDIFNEEEEENQ